jgi:hypothetical protein
MNPDEYARYMSALEGVVVLWEAHRQSYRVFGIELPREVGLAILEGVIRVHAPERQIQVGYLPTRERALWTTLGYIF